MKNKGEVGVILAYIAVCVFWGSTYLAIRVGVAIDHFPPMLFAGIRFVMAGVIVLVFAAIRRYEFPATFTDVCKTSMTGIFLLVGGNGVVVWAEQRVDSGITALLLAATPLFIAVIEAVFFRQKKLGMLGWVCLCVGFVGVSMLIVSGTGIGSTDVKGGLTVLFASLMLSIGSVYSKEVRVKGDTIAKVGIQMAISGMVLLSVSGIMGEKVVQLNSSVVMAMLYLVFFGSIIGYSANIYVISKWPASIALSSAYVNPVIAVVLGAIVLSERINANMLVAMLITLAAVIVLQVYKERLVNEGKHIYSESKTT